MKTPKHTPGPWTVKGEDTVVGPQGNTIAECCGYSIRATDKDQIRQGGREANATLIAAAPAMYEALQQLAHVEQLRKQAVTENDYVDLVLADSKLQQLAQAVLAQAEGNE